MCEDIYNIMANEADYNVFITAFSTAPIGMILVDTECKIKRINESWKKMMVIDEMSALGKSFGDGFICIESLLSGCGSGVNCIKCKIRYNIANVMKTGKPEYDIVVNNEFIINNRKVSPWLKTDFIPVTFEGEKYVLVASVDITE
jgi:PAS domain-containing protein